MTFKVNPGHPKWCHSANEMHFVSSCQCNYHNCKLQITHKSFTNNSLHQHLQLLAIQHSVKSLYLYTCTSPISNDCIILLPYCCCVSICLKKLTVHCLYPSQCWSLSVLDLSCNTHRIGGLLIMNNNVQCITVTDSRYQVRNRNDSFRSKQAWTLHRPQAVSMEEWCRKKLFTGTVRRRDSKHSQAVPFLQSRWLHSLCG